MTNKELCEWLIANSSGTYRNSAVAAMVIGSQDERIADLSKKLDQAIEFIDPVARALLLAEWMESK